MLKEGSATETGEDISDALDELRDLLRQQKRGDPVYPLEGNILQLRGHLNTLGISPDDERIKAVEREVENE